MSSRGPNIEDKGQAPSCSQHQERGGGSTTDGQDLIRTLSSGVSPVTGIRWGQAARPQCCSSCPGRSGVSTLLQVTAFLSLAKGCLQAVRVFTSLVLRSCCLLSHCCLKTQVCFFLFFFTF